MSAIRVAGLTKRYGEVTAVAGVSFEVRRGETFGILGPNGAGKTTTLEMIEGLTPPDAGELELLGEPVWPHPARLQRRIGVQLQSTSVFARLTARELLDLFGRFYGVAPGARTTELLAMVGLEEKGRAQAAELSGGQQQRLAIALALIHEPEVVFLDEPTTGLDPQARRNLWDVIRAVGERGCTVVLTTHYLEEAEQLCDRVAIMDAGQIVALDTPQELIRSLGPRSRVTFDAPGLTREALLALPGTSEASVNGPEVELLTLDAQRTLVALIALAERESAELRHLSVREPSLEDVFLELTGREFRE